jgi:hypothetical protein
MLVTIQTIASPLPPQLRSEFLKALARELGDREVGDAHKRQARPALVRQSLRPAA